MPILFSLDGQGVQVHEMQVNNFLGMGYRTTVPDEPKPASKPTPTPTEPTAELIKINFASLKDLSEKLGLTTQQSKEVRDGRPYANVEDLIAKVSTITWIGIENISYEA
ncbi:MAG: hypothetical protein ACKPKT_13565 [Dolichospermum sp.]